MQAKLSKTNAQCRQAHKNSLYLSLLRSNRENQLTICCMQQAREKQIKHTQLRIKCTFYNFLHFIG